MFHDAVTEVYCYYYIWHMTWINYLNILKRTSCFSNSFGVKRNTTTDTRLSEKKSRFKVINLLECRKLVIHVKRWKVRCGFCMFSTWYWFVMYLMLKVYMMGYNTQSLLYFIDGSTIALTLSTTINTSLSISISFVDQSLFSRAW